MGAVPSCRRPPCSQRTRTRVGHPKPLKVKVVDNAVTGRLGQPPSVMEKDFRSTTEQR